MRPSRSLHQYFKHRIKSLWLPALLLSAFNPVHADEPTPPQLSVTETAAGSLIENATVSFGTVARSSISSPKTLQLFNSGSSPLTVTQIRLQGGNTSDFRLGAVTLPMVILQGGTAQVELTTRPISNGLRSTVLQIVSNHSGTAETLFPLNLSANAVSPVTVEFAGNAVQITQTTASAVLTLTRRSTTLPQTVRVKTVNGTPSYAPYFQGAVAGIDYIPMDQIVTFGVGQPSRTVTLQLNVKTSSDTPNRRLSLVLSEPTGGAVLGRSNMLVNIMATDTTKPVLSVTLPDAQTTSIDAAASPIVTVQGTATDTKGIARVTLSLNNSTASTIPFTATSIPQGTETLPGDSRDISFSKSILARLGANKLVITAFDVRGNASIITRNFNYTGGVPISVERIVPSQHSAKPNNAGSVRLKANPVSHVTPLASTLGAQTQQSLAVPGATMTLTAVPSGGHAFSHFDQLPQGAQVVGATATFTMPADPTAVRAHFVAQPYTAPAGYGETFQGLLRFDETALDNQGKSPSAVSCGMVTATITSLGALTGTIQIDQSSQSFIGQAYADGRVTLGASASALGEKLIVGQHEITISYDLADRKALIANAFHSPTSTHSKGYLRRAYYSAARKVPTQFRGYHTVQIYHPDFMLNNLTNTHPGGTGFASFTISETGLATVSAELPDGSPFSCKTILVDEISTSGSDVLVGDNAVIPVYAQVKPPGVSSSAPKGTYISQWLFYRLGSNPQVADDSTSDVISTTEGPGIKNWFRPAYAGSVAYASGWPTGLELNAVGNRYNRTLTSQQTLAAPAPVSGDGNIWLGFNGGKLSTASSPSVTKSFNVVSNAINQFGSLDSEFKLTISPSTGIVFGTFRPNWLNPASTPPSFRGMILQPLPTQLWKPECYGSFQSNIVGDSAPQIGWFRLLPRQ